MKDPLPTNAGDWNLSWEEQPVGSAGFREWTHRLTATRGEDRVHLTVDLSTGYILLPFTQIDEGEQEAMRYLGAILNGIAMGGR